MVVGAVFKVVVVVEGRVLVVLVNGGSIPNVDDLPVVVLVGLVIAF